MEQGEGFGKLVDGLLYYEQGDNAAARESWSSAEGHGPLPALFARTLLANLRGDRPSANPYELHPSKADYRQIDLFEQIRQLEFVHIAQQLVANVHSASRPETTLLDLGIGRGQLTAELVASSKGNIVRVIGVDIDPDNVEESREVLDSLGVEFVGIARDFAELDWDTVRGHCRGPVNVNASFSLHHLDLEGKTRLLEQVADLDPFRVTIVEPSSSHGSADMLERLVRCYAHYSALWSAILASTIRRDAQRAVVRFLGREITDIMRDDPVRYQRDEYWAFWYRLMLRAGLRPVPYEAFQLDPEVVQLLPGAANVHAQNTHLITSFSFTSSGTVARD